MKEVIEEIKPSPDTIIDETGQETPPPLGNEKTETKEEEEIVPTKRSLDDTRLLMDVREMAQAAGLAWYSDGFDAIPEKYHLYKYSDAQKKMLIEAWAPIIQKSNIKVSPAVKILMVEGMCSGPIIALAQQNRNYRKALADAKAKIEQLERDATQRSSEEVQRMYRQEFKPSLRKDNKNAWRIDEQGFFEYRSDGASTSRIKAAERKDRPKLPDDYPMLIKYNEKEKVHQIFDIPISNEESEV